jgi:hypothetical protein
MSPLEACHALLFKAATSVVPLAGGFGLEARALLIAQGVLRPRGDGPAEPEPGDEPPAAEAVPERAAGYAREAWRGGH